MFKPTSRQRANLLKLAEYLESLPKGYKHFDMSTFVEHYGDCAIEETTAAFKKDPGGYLDNCGTVACALGHGPAAGVALRSDDLEPRYRCCNPVYGVKWLDYSKRAFGVDHDDTCDEQPTGFLTWQFLFGGSWSMVDDHHWGAAARIRYVLACGRYPEGFDDLDHEDYVRFYAPYRKGSRGKTRKQIDDAKALALA